MKTGPKSISVVQVNCTFDKGLTDPDELLARYFTLTGWSDARLWVGRWNANKHPLTVLDGFARAASALPNATLTMIYSEADLLEAVRDRVRLPDLSGRVRLIGPVPHDRMAACYSERELSWAAVGQRAMQICEQVLVARCSGLAPSS